MRRIAVLDDEKVHLDAAVALISEYEAARGVRFAVECFCSPSDFLDKIENGAFQNHKRIPKYIGKQDRLQQIRQS